MNEAVFEPSYCEYHAEVYFARCQHCEEERAEHAAEAAAEDPRE